MKFRMFFVLVALFLVALPIQAQDAEITIARDATRGDILPVQAADVFPNTLTAVYAIVEVEDLEPGDEFDIVWYYEGDELDGLTLENEGDTEDFSAWSNWSDPDGLPAGDWEVQVEYDGDVIASEEFEIVDDEYVFPVRFGADCGRETGWLLNEGQEFEEIFILYAYLEYSNFNDVAVDVIWTIDDEEYDLGVEGVFDNSEEDVAWECFAIFNTDEFLPEGEYGIIILNEDGDELYESDDSLHAELEN